jgi:cell division septum initiation protein DivIVA
MVISGKKKPPDKEELRKMLDALVKRREALEVRLSAQEESINTMRQALVGFTKSEHK